MIFLTVGTQLTFDRMVKAVDTWCKKVPDVGIFGQISDPGAKGYRPAHFEWQDFIGPEEFNKRFNAANLIVAHAGMGSIISALTASKPIIIMPRSAALGEHRNEHQRATAEKFGRKEGVYVAWDETELAALLTRLSKNPPVTAGAAASAFAEPKLIETLRDFIHMETKT